jgi:hypothetical protein
MFLFLGPRVDSCEHMFASLREQVFYGPAPRWRVTNISDRSIIFHALLSFAAFLSKIELEKFKSSLLSMSPNGFNMCSSSEVQGYILEEYVRLSPRTTPLWFGTALSKYEYLNCGIGFPLAVSVELLPFSQKAF